MMRDVPDMEIHYEEEWAALYVDGRLERVGDAYLAEERAMEIAGVKTVHDDAFMRGQNGRDGVAQTVDEVHAYATERSARLARAAALREEAARLEAGRRRDHEERVTNPYRVAPPLSAGPRGTVTVYTTPDRRTMRTRRATIIAVVIALSAAWDAAGDAAWAAARERLAPTVDQLQDSAINLYAALINPRSTPA